MKKQILNTIGFAVAAALFCVTCSDNGLTKNPNSEAGDANALTGKFYGKDNPTTDPCAINPAPACPNYCDVNPTAPGCPGYVDPCKENPTPDCPNYCQTHQDEEQCKNDPCAVDPAPECTNYCQVHPDADQCKGDPCAVNPAPDCPNYCDVYPTVRGCPGYCDANPTVAECQSKPITYTLTVTRNPLNGGNFTVNGGQNNPGPSTHNAGTSVTVKAAPNSGYTFKNWSGASTSTNATVTITMNENKTLTANFQAVTVQPTMYTLTVSASPAAGGTVSPAVGAHSYENGESVTVTATPNSGYTFKNWSGTGAPTPATDNPATVMMNGNKTLTANFEQDPCAANLTPNCPNYCDVNKTAPQCQTDPCITNPTSSCTDYCTRESLVSNISDGVSILQDLNGSGDWGYNYYWMLLLFNDANATYTQSGDELTINVSRVGSKEWHVGITHSVPLIYGKKYTISFQARKETDRQSPEMNVDFGGPDGPCEEGVVDCNGGSYIDWGKDWKNAAFNDNPYGSNYPVENTWKDFSYTFEMEYSNDLQGQVRINVGHSTGTIKIRNITVKPADCR